MASRPFSSSSSSTPGAKALSIHRFFGRRIHHPGGVREVGLSDRAVSARARAARGRRSAAPVGPKAASFQRNTERKRTGGSDAYGRSVQQVETKRVFTAVSFDMRGPMQTMAGLGFPECLLCIQPFFLVGLRSLFRWFSCFEHGKSLGDFSQAPLLDESTRVPWRWLWAPCVRNPVSGLWSRRNRFFLSYDYTRTPP